MQIRVNHPLNNYFTSMIDIPKQSSDHWTFNFIVWGHQYTLKCENEKYKLTVIINHNSYNYPKKEFEIIKTFDDLKQGDKIYAHDNDHIMVLHVIDCNILTSHPHLITPLVEVNTKEFGIRHFPLGEFMERYGSYAYYTTKKHAILNINWIKKGYISQVRSINKSLKELNYGTQN